ncbi:conserved hypothetical protein [Sulfurovum sp. enrichment culture clone C5]|uniref:DUF177 domain-containing protein n=1 Tax=Sulfurovum sp. enrichment culture clone C5 TaxID=497650 RepID=A0A0S4XRB2_9BACT|nr:conserved hypothetical protein [Sulfurovum sp. enrichment culture clone C5]
MEISFDKISVNPKPFSLAINSVTFSGKLSKINFNTVKLDGEINGDLEVCCDRCGEAFVIDIEQPISLELSQKEIQNKDNLDIIEFLDGTIDLKYILQSEIDSIKSLYHYCEKCDGIEEFEVEI